MNTPNEELQPAFNGESESIKGHAGGSTPPSSTTHPPSLTPSKRQAEVYGTYTGHGLAALYAAEEKAYEAWGVACDKERAAQDTDLERFLDARTRICHERRVTLAWQIVAAIAERKALELKKKNNPIRKYLIPICLVSACTSIPLVFISAKVVSQAVSGQ